MAPTLTCGAISKKRASDQRPLPLLPAFAGLVMVFDPLIELPLLPAAAALPPVSRSEDPVVASRDIEPGLLMLPAELLVAELLVGPVLPPPCAWLGCAAAHVVDNASMAAAAIVILLVDFMIYLRNKPSDRQP